MIDLKKVVPFQVVIIMQPWLEAFCFGNLIYEMIIVKQLMVIHPEDLYCYDTMLPVGNNGAAKSKMDANLHFSKESLNARMVSTGNPITIIVILTPSTTIEQFLKSNLFLFT